MFRLKLAISSLFGTLNFFIQLLYKLVSVLLVLGTLLMIYMLISDGKGMNDMKMAFNYYIPYILIAITLLILAKLISIAFNKIEYYFLQEAINSSPIRKEMQKNMEIEEKLYRDNEFKKFAIKLQNNGYELSTLSIPSISKEEHQRIMDNNPVNLKLDGPFARIVTKYSTISPETGYYIKNKYGNLSGYNKSKLMMLSFAKEFSRRNPLYRATEHFYSRPTISTEAMEAIFDCLELGVNPLNHIEETSSNENIILFRHSIIQDHNSKH